ncbi:MAG: HAD-IC family P-type ATPase [Legionella sp.]|nr:HAD-IC family P-type ATPase [Legionella sp.]
MTQKVIFETSLLLGKIMCFDACGNKIHTTAELALKNAIAQGILPADAELIMDSAPQDFGFHKVTFLVATEKNFQLTKKDNEKLQAMLQQGLERFAFQDMNLEATKVEEDKTHQHNLWINLIAMSAISLLSLLFPPSLLLTSVLTGLSLFSSTYTARNYLSDFFHNLKTPRLSNMSTTISLGWFLSFAHTLMHVISMPLMSGFSMIVMNFIMPVALITGINVMDEIKRLLLKKANQIQLKGLKKLFPEMSEEYVVFPFPKKFVSLISNHLNTLNAVEKKSLVDQMDCNSIEKQVGHFLKKANPYNIKKSFLKQGMVIQVKVGECFPVDCKLIDQNTVIDASLLTGEPFQNIKRWEEAPAGAINLGQTVHVYTCQDSYHSTVNRLLYPSNRRLKPIVPADAELPTNNKEKFVYFYGAVVIISLLAAIAIPALLGVSTLSMLMQNTISILFAVCPCTIAMAHQLPKLISLSSRRQYPGLALRNERLIDGKHDRIHTIVFDKTGTLTTGSSRVRSTDIASESSLWQKIYLLEKLQGNGHPIAHAIQKHYNQHIGKRIIFNDVNNAHTDPLNRGIEGQVQGKHLVIGNPDYLKSKGIDLHLANTAQIKHGLTPVYVAEEGLYKGTIYIEHTLRKDVLSTLTRLKRNNTNLVLLTGDTLASAQAFNQQIGHLFPDANIHAQQGPQEKKNFLNQLMSNAHNPEGIWFVGDGLNDGSCCRVVTEQGGVSCSMNINDKSTFFTDLSLNNSLTYLHKHPRLNQRLWQSIFQNQGILAYSMLTFLGFVISFSLLGIGIPPMIPTVVMLSTTLATLFNTYRLQIAAEVAFNPAVSWPKKIIASHFSLGMLLGASLLLTSSLLLATIVTGAFTLPLLTFSAGAALGVASAFTLSALSLLGAFAGLFTATLLSRPAHQESRPGIKASAPLTLASSNDRILITDHSHAQNSLNRRLTDECSERHPSFFARSLIRTQSEKSLEELHLPKEISTPRHGKLG